MPDVGGIEGRPPGMETVRAAMELLKLDDHAVWTAYLEMLGRHNYQELVDAIHGRARLSHIEYNKLAAALNDRFYDRGHNHPMTYLDTRRDQDQPPAQS